MPAFSVDLNKDGVKLFQKSIEKPKDKEKLPGDDHSDDVSADKTGKKAGESAKDPSTANRSFQLSQLLQFLPQVDVAKPTLTPLLNAMVNELVQWKSIDNGKGVDVKVNDLPLRMVLTRVEGKLNLVLYAGGELKNQLFDHQRELIALLKKKDIDLSGLNVLELGDYVNQPGGSGNQNSGGQSRENKSQKQVAQFDTLMKGDINDISNF